MMIANLQVLRGIAALMVVVHHIFDRAVSEHTQIFASGVDLFFVISGFIMVYTTRASDPTISGFLWSRAARVIPMYWLVTTATFIAGAAGMAFFGHHQIEVSHLLQSLLFVPGFDANGAEIMPIVYVGWTLNFEMFFYGCFALTLLAGRSLSHRELLVAPIFAGVAVAAAVSDDPILGYYSNNVVWEFVFGVIIASFLPVATISQGRDARIGAWLLIAASVVWLLAAAAHSPLEARSIAFGLPAAGIVVAALILEQLGSKISYPFLLLIGGASYSIYLLHLFVLQIIGKFMSLTHIDHSAIGVGFGYAVMLLASVAIGIVCYRLVEMPVTSALQRRRSRLTAAA